MLPSCDAGAQSAQTQEEKQSALRQRYFGLSQFTLQHHLSIGFIQAPSADAARAHELLSLARRCRDAAACTSCTVTNAEMAVAMDAEAGTSTLT
jgi:hypothetical protein